MTSPKRWLNYDKAPLSLKIFLPFTLVFLGFWMISGVLLGHYFSQQLDRQQVKRSAELSSLLKRDINQKLYGLRRSARLMAGDEPIVRGVEQSNSRLLQKNILPLKSILETDVTTLIDRNQQVLLNARSSGFGNREIRDQAAIDLLLTGADISTTVGTSELGPPVIIGTAPVKNEQGIVGGIILGTAIDRTLLADINESIQEQIVVLADHTVVASTFPIETTKPDWDIFYETANFYRTEAADTDRIATIQGEPFLLKALIIDGLEEERFEVFLLISQASLIQAKQTLWAVIITLASVGAGFTAIISYWIARRIAKPIRELTAISQQVVTENDFTLQVPVYTKDEIGTLSTSLNQLIQWVKQYTCELENLTQTLEAKVNERTQALSKSIGELKETQAQLIQTEKMSSLGQMVAGIAHEINNPVSFIQGNLKPLNTYFQDLIALLEAYQEEYPDPSESIVEKQEEIDLDFLLEDTSKIFSSIKMGTQRVRDIVVSLRNFSRLDEATIKDADLCEGLDSTLLILNHRIKLGITVEKQYAPLPLITCSPAQLNQVFTNIIANALDAMLEADVHPKRLTITTHQLDHQSVQVSIRDSGPGMPESVKAKIFDPFFTTKPVGKGTGIGLGICFKIIQQHQGRIEVNSVVGQGTEFLITLPITGPTHREQARES